MYLYIIYMYSTFSALVENLGLQENQEYRVEVCIIKDCGAHLTTVEQIFTFHVSNDDDDTSGGDDTSSGNTGGVFDANKKNGGSDDDTNNKDDDDTNTA